MRIESFSDRFTDKNISTETLAALLQVPYQREILFDLALGENINSPFITTAAAQVIRVENKDFLIFVLLSTREKVLQEVKKVKGTSGQKIKYIAFTKNKENMAPEEVTLINPHDWMHAIISHGINRGILHLQFMRDLEFEQV